MEARSLELMNLLNVESFTSEDGDFFHVWVDIVASALAVPIVGIYMLIDGKQELIAHKGFIKKRLFASGDSFFHFTLEQNDCLIVRDCVLDPRFRDSYYVENSPYIVSYAGMPLLNEKLGKIGTLFVADHELREFPQDMLNRLKVFTKQLQSILTDKIDKESLLKKEHDQMKSMKHFIHDLKSPMSIIKISLDMLRSNGQVEEMSSKLMNRCQNNLRKTLLTIDELLKSDSLNIEHDKLKIESCDLQAFIKAAVGELQYFIGEDQQVTTQVEKKEIFSDLKLVRTIIDNLISNAVKYGAGSDITIKSKSFDNAVEISVCDEGQGVDDESKEKIFSLGYKKEGDMLLKHGIGLHFCKVSAERLGGGLTVSDNSPKGSRFMLRLPL